MVQTFASVDEILKCDLWNEKDRTALSCGAVYYAVQGGSNFWVCGWKPKVGPFKWERRNSTFLWYCLLCCTRRFYNFWVCGWKRKIGPLKWNLLSSTFLWCLLLSLRMKTWSGTIQMKATEQCFPVVLFIILWKAGFIARSISLARSRQIWDYFPF